MVDLGCVSCAAFSIRSEFASSRQQIFEAIAFPSQYRYVQLEFLVIKMDRSLDCRVVGQCCNAFASAISTFASSIVSNNSR